MNAIRSRWYGMDNSTRNYLMIAGIVVGSAALLTYPAILLYRRFRDRKNQHTSTEMDANDTKSFAPAYRAKHKPHHRKADANGHIAN